MIDAVGGIDVTAQLPLPIKESSSVAGETKHVDGWNMNFTPDAMMILKGRLGVRTGKNW